MAFLLGIDGGATGTVAILAEPDGTVCAIAHAGASNYLTVGEDGSRNALQTAVNRVFEQNGASQQDCVAACFGLSALGSPQDRQAYRYIIDGLGLPSDVLLESDVVIAWAAATGGQPGIGVISGTGSSCFGVNAKGKRFRALGWDYILADQGSGYWIGLQGLQTAMKVYDGRIADSRLLDAMVDHFELSGADDMLTRAYEPDFTKGTIASFAKRVVACAQDGDLYAQRILEQAGEELAGAVLAVARHLEMIDLSVPVGLIGGIWRAGDIIVRPFAHHIYAEMPHAEINEAQFPAVAGAVILAKQQIGDIDEVFLANLLASSAALANQLRAK